MGRTVLPYSHVLESEREKLKPFRRALSKEDQLAFDRLFDRAKMGTPMPRDGTALKSFYFRPPVNILCSPIIPASIDSKVSAIYFCSFSAI
jgi:hypothetical protein